MTMSWTFSAKKADRIASEIARVDAKLKFNPNNRKSSDYKVRLLDALMHAGVTMASDKKSYLTTNGGFLWLEGKTVLVKPDDINGPARYKWVKGE